nr:transposase [Alicyclobacillus mengziensis]
MTGNISAAYDCRPYFREEACTELGIGFKSKIDLAIELVQDFDVSDDERVYVLFDRWYASKRLIDACNAKGFHVIAAFKTNRMMYPSGIQVKVSDFAQQYIRHTDLRSVTVGDHR